MKKIICLFLIIFTISIINVSAAVDMTAKPIEFAPTGEGKFIYCNSYEFIRRQDLADTSNQEAKYIMNNTLTSDKYSMFVSHVNHTELRDESGKITEPGFDIELDVFFKAIEDTKIIITAIGFEVPEHSKYFYEGEEYTVEEAWGCMHAWADYLKMPIRELDSGKRYNPREFSDIEINLKKGESVWLSEYIQNYCPVPFYRPVLLLADFTVESGKTEANVAAMRSTGKLKDRSRVHPNPAFGHYEREKQYKGISDLPNRLQTSLSYTVADWVGECEFPVVVKNAFVPDGKEITRWFTHLNPYADIWNKENAVANDMLKFKYEDNRKLSYYGSRVPKSKRDNVWEFAIDRADYTEYPGKVSGYGTTNYIPNSILGTDATSEEACNLGNYGVSLEYKITITNEGKITRYANYKLNTTSNNIVILKDENGNPINNYALCKGEHASKETDTMACVELPGGTTTTFIVEVILPTNYVGGMENSLTLTNEKSLPKTYISALTKVPQDLSFTGREYIKWYDCRLYKSKDKINWTEVNISPEFAKALDGNWSQYEFLYTDNGYMVKPSLYDSRPYYDVREFFKTVYFLNDDFSLESSYTFYQYPTDMSYADGVYYVTAGSKYSSVDTENWTMSDGTFNLPVGNRYSYTNYKSSNGNYFFCDGSGFLEAIYEGEKPEFIDVAGDAYYCIDGNALYVSFDGMYFDTFKTDGVIERVSKIDDTLYINDKPYTYKKYRNLTVRVDNKYVVFNNRPYEENGVSYAPYEFLKKVCNAEIAIAQDELTVKNGCVYVPIAEFCKINGFSVFYDEEFHRVTIAR